MKKLVLSAAALTLTSSGFASDEDWSAFDSAYAQDVEALASTLSAESDGAKLSGYIQTLYTNDSDPNPKISGFDVPRARFSLTGQRKGYGYKLQYDAAGEPTSGGSTESVTGNGRLLDAYIDVPIGGEASGESSIKARAGLFKPWVARQGLISSSRLFFLDRSAIANEYQSRGVGFSLSGDFDALNWAVTIQNGVDGQADDYLTALRLAFNFMGKGTGNVEGAYAGSSEISGMAGVAYVDDSGLPDAETILVETHIASNLYSFGVEFMDVGDGGISSNSGNAGMFAMASPITVYGTYMLVEDMWELGVRYQDLDQQVGDYTIIDVGLNHYVDGHDLKWSFGYTMVEQDNTTPGGPMLIDSGILRLGLQLAF